MFYLLKKITFLMMSPLIFALFFTKYTGNRAKRFLYYPVFDDMQELLHHYYAAGYFLPGGDGCRVVFQVSSQLRGDLGKIEDLAVPEYMGECLQKEQHNIHFEVARPSPLWRVLLRYRPVSVLLWRNVQPERMVTHLALQTGLVWNVDRSTTWGCYSYPAFKFGLTVPAERKARNREMHARFKDYVATRPTFYKSYLFGTGPSIERAFDYDFSDGYRIVCNTMIKNVALMEHLKPHFMIAGDGIYHFGISRYACRFRKDLEIFLMQYGCLFLIPDCYYDNFVAHNEGLREFTVPVPYSARRINLRLKENFEIKFFHNILNQLLLPVASSLSDNVLLLGFDGRAPTDRHFWKSTDSVNYEDLKEYHQQAHPGFFKGVDYPGYADLQSACAERIMRVGERMNKRYYSLNQSGNQALQKRFLSDPTRLPGTEPSC